MDKVKREKNSHFYYIYDNGKTIEMEKKPYDTEYECTYACYLINISDHSIHKANPYKCTKCGKWHIGHNNNKVLSKLDKVKLIEKFKKFKIKNHVNNFIR